MKYFIITIHIFFHYLNFTKTTGSGYQPVKIQGPEMMHKKKGGKSTAFDLSNSGHILLKETARDF
jgi:hypothetical protein